MLLRTSITAHSFCAMALFISCSSAPILTHAATRTFTSSDTYTVPANATSVSVLVVAGGGGAGFNGGGGGGGGGIKCTTVTVTPGSSITVTIGDGGAAAVTNFVRGSNGGDSSFGNVTATGGGGGGSRDGQQTGGSGGGGAGGAGGAPGGSGTSGQGSNGGNGYNNGGASAGGGGGGAGAAGTNGSYATGGAGGNGTTCGITGATVYGGGGGGACPYGYSCSPGAGGSGGGGGGSLEGGTNGAANTGGGGGGGGNSAGSGGSGIVVVSDNAILFTQGVTVTGTASVNGTIAKGSGSFVIDHPLDPKNKLLYHSFVESPDVKNLYDGVATLDGNGEARIEMPGYSLALNTDMRYFANAVDRPMPNLFVKEEARRAKWLGIIPHGNPFFVVAGGEPGGEISWQVSGIRRDPYILANPIIPEVEKSDATLVKKGECLFKPLCD